VAVQGRRLTSADVARESGVSRATVSYVLNGAPNQVIPERTRQRVLEAAERLGYAPYAPARALRSGRSDVVLFLIPEWPIGTAIATLIEHLSARLADVGLTLVVHAHPRAARPVSELWKAITPAALINHQALSPAEEAAAEKAGMLLITPVFRPRGGRTFRSFQRRIGELQVHHLAQLGHWRLGFAMPDDDRLHAFTAPRRDGVTRACTDLGLPAPMVLTIPLDAAAAERAVGRWMAAEPPVTGICGYNDEVALAVLAGLRKLSLSAPGDLAVIGVDDIPAARLSAPPLTTVATGMAVFGEHLADLVSSSLTGKPRPPRPAEEVLTIVRRESTLLAEPPDLPCHDPRPTVSRSVRPPEARPPVCTHVQIRCVCAVRRAASSVLMLSPAGCRKSRYRHIAGIAGPALRKKRAFWKKRRRKPAPYPPLVFRTFGVGVVEAGGVWWSPAVMWGLSGLE